MNKTEIISKYKKLDAATVFSGIRSVLIKKSKENYNDVTGYEKSYMTNVYSQTNKGTMVGFAKTLRMLPPRMDLINELPSGENSAEFLAMSSCNELNVLVIDAMGLSFASVGGDVKFLNLHINKAAGLVTDGAIRDLEDVTKYDFSIFSGSRTASVGIPHVYPYESNVPIACGQTLVKPEDLIIGDSEGVVVVPNFIINEVLAWSTEHKKQETYIKNKSINEKVSTGKYYNNEFFKKLNKGDKYDL